MIVPQDMDERVKFAEESDRMAQELFDYVFPPWRWLKWHRLHREIKRRDAALRAANARTRQELGL